MTLPVPHSGPQLAVSAAIFRDGKVLLVRGARPPAKGAYTLPGGRVEFDESVMDAVLREVREETGLSIEIIGLVRWQEMLPADTDGYGHFVILPFAARWTAGEAHVNDELHSAIWLAPEDIRDMPLTPGLMDVVARASAMVGV